MRVLVIEDDLTLNKNITQALTAENYQVDSVYDGSLAERLMRKDQYDCIILDVNLPGKNGFDICREFRQHNFSTPVIILTAFSELDDKVQGFSCGADDYLTKPFYMRELLLRVSVLVRRKSQRESQALSGSKLIFKDIELDYSTKKVFRKGQEIILTPREYQILYLLMKNPGEIVSKNQLIKEIWGPAYDGNTNSVEVYINFLRNKLDRPFQKNTIKTRFGFGYYLDNSDEN
ncbi:MAG: response regulator transcription factor [Cyclobacteriaceae bacterium]|nr:response regulator transcription factor [Cyclobacteriaceae bacterium]MCX7636478.1 response regulator transcription factor [Cyclobacteriaceae bacterium]MDW8330511.1 response regulator transcription factor [Cyclobacteriaceae bacterium]